MMACCLSNLSIVQYLIALGADANVMNAEKVTAMMCTLNQANPNRMRQAMIVRHLLDVGCQSMNWTNTDGNTALHLAILANNDLVVELFSGSKSLFFGTVTKCLINFFLVVGLDIQVQNYSGYNVSELVYSLPNCDTKILSIVEEMWERLEAVADQKGDALLQLEASSTVSVGKNSSKAARRKKSKDKKLKKQILKKQEEVCLKKEDFSKSLESKENGSPELDVEHVQDEQCIDMDPIDVFIREADDDDDVSQWVTVTRGKDGFKKEEFSNQNNSELSRSELSDPQLPGLVKNGTSSTTWIIHDRIDSTPIPSLPLDSGRIARPAGLLDSSALPINVDETLKEAFRSIDSRTEVLDLSVPHFLGMQVDSLSLAQLECLSRAHMILCRRIDAIKLGRLMSLKQDSLGHLSLVPDSPSPI